uniref:Uncharacterized protein n=1 Tax=Pygocentrus nattereri TaxID=42514 RepID=A0AAR2KQM8_PYGNA
MDRREATSLPLHYNQVWVNNPTLGEFCFTMIGRADIEGSKSDVTMNAWPPQASYPCDNFSGTSRLKPKMLRGRDRKTLCCMRDLYHLPWIFKGQQELSRRCLCHVTFQGSGPYLGKQELFPVPPPASPGSFALSHWTPCVAPISATPGSGILAQLPFGWMGVKEIIAPAFPNGICLSLRTD